ncbi:MAG: hypothetical protein ACOC0D_02900, partial [Spirochaeta sp.]
MRYGLPYRTPGAPLQSAARRASARHPAMRGLPPGSLRDAAPRSLQDFHCALLAEFSWFCFANHCHSWDSR